MLAEYFRHYVIKQHATYPLAPLQVNSAKNGMGQAEQDPDLPRFASNVLAKSNLTTVQQSGGASRSAGRASQL